MNMLEECAVKKAMRRLVPLVVICYFVACLDRVNVGFAALEMNKDLGLTAAAFGFGSGLFFLTYFALEVPSNLLLARFGARRWIARIMFTWGLMSGGMAFVTNETSFYTLRLLLGAAEAGFFPGIAFFLTLWFPAAYRARVMGYFLAAAPLALVFGGPVSGALLGLDGFLGLAGWRWMFIIEAVPALVLAGVVLAYLTDRPAIAAWLTTEERKALAERLAIEEQDRPAVQHDSLFKALFNPRVLFLSLAHFAIVLSIYGVSFFMPRIIKEFGLTNLQTGFVSSTPYIIAVISLVWWGRRSDAKLERRFHTAVPVLFAGAGLAAAALLVDPTAKMIAFGVAAMGSFGALPAFWSLSMNALSTKQAPGAIAVIGAVGNLGGFVGPSVMGLAKDHTGTFTAGLLLLAGTALVAAIIVLVIGGARPRPGAYRQHVSPSK